MVKESTVTICCKQHEASEGQGEGDEHVVAVETEQRPNKSTIGRDEAAAAAERGEKVCCSHPQHVSALLLSELSDAVCAHSHWWTQGGGRGDSRPQCLKKRSKSALLDAPLVDYT